MHKQALYTSDRLICYNVNMLVNIRSLIGTILFVFLFSVISGGQSRSLYASSFEDNFYFSTHGSIFYFASDNGKQGADPAPVLPSIGITAAYKISGPLRIQFTEDIYFTNYEYNAERGYAMACNPENRSAFVLGFITGIQAAGYFPIGNNGMDIHVFGGPAADLRLITLAFGLNHPDDFTGDPETDAQMQTDAIRDYFWSKGRWFMPTAGAGINFAINEKYLLGFDIRAWFPVYRMWTDGQLPAIDGWRFGVGLRITPRKNAGSAADTGGAVDAVGTEIKTTEPEEPSRDTE